MSEQWYTSIPKLGFGLMRLPTLPGGSQKDIDFDKVQEMIDLYMSRGFSYFDTAYVYHEGHSEEVVKKCLVPKYPRDSFQVVDKIPLWSIRSYEDYEPILRTQLERTGLECLDVLFLHGIGTQQFQMLEDTRGWDFLKSAKERGLVKHIGFSYHSPALELDALLDKHPEVEVVQLQINYLDWESPEVQSRACYEACRRHGVAVTIMEPVKGGSLADPHPDVSAIFRAADPKASVASWAIRFAASLDGIITVLSGMSTLEQVRDNTQTMLDFQPLTPEERKVIARAVAKFNEIPLIPCTGCRYCAPDCPQKINIPGILASLNDYTKYQNAGGLGMGYRMAVGQGGKAGDCVECRSCEEHCPQHLKITQLLKKAAEVFEK
ncbi:MAG: aldo/keto reductase [Oscillospiraceae bacterium]|nr:aldo/keto reductase [Oscillospiraceae bacterium]